MANISETELQRRLRSLERTSGSSTEHNYVSNGDPEAGSYTEGDTHYNASTNNLWLFSNGAWALDSTVLHVRYADDVTTKPPVVQSDVVGFDTDPLAPDGSIKNWRGLWWGNLTASTDPTDYEWHDTDDLPPELERYRTENVGLRSSVGTPDAPGVGVTWIPGSPTATTMWLADRFTIDGQKGPWEVYPVQAAEHGLPFIRYEKTGFNQPVLGDSVWISDVVLAAISFTGRPFTNQKELGYGAVVAIVYDDGTLAGKYIRSAGIDAWVAPASVIDGDLVVDGTIVGDKIQANNIEALHLTANSIDSTKLVISGANAIGASTIGADPAGSAAAAELYADGLRTALISNEIAGVQAIADGKIESFFQDAEPTTGMSVGDLWFDTDEGNKPYRYSGTLWVLAQDDGLKVLADDAQATADGKITTYFQTAEPTTDLSVGDLWFDTDDGNKPYRYSGTSWVDAQDNGLLSAAEAAQATADGKIESFFQTTEPTTGISVGDLWFDTDDGNKPYRYSGTLWVLAQDDGLKVLANDAQATADGKITTYFQTAEPTTDLSVGDLWFDTDDGNRPYRYSGTSWVDVQDNGLLSVANNAQATADGKIESFFQTTEPTTGMSVGDLWFDTDDGNKPYRYSGTLWVLAQDDGLKVLADDAQATADGKITTYFQIAAPTTDLSVGDLWFDTDDGNKPYRYNGTSWVLAQDSGLATLANDAQATADGKIDSFFQDAAPTTGMSVGDLWFDTDDGNKPYRHNGTLWVLAQDDGLKVLAEDAQATADGKITTYFQTAAPTTDLSVGDLWFDLDDGNKPYRYNGTLWVLAQDSGLAALANDAQATADGKIDSFFQDAEPTTGMSVGDLWFDTDDGNKPYRHNGTSWVLAQDDSLKVLADDAQATADGKITTYFQTAAPTTDLSVGDLWFDLDDNNKPYRYSGSNWVDTQDLGLKLLAEAAQATADGKIESFFQTTAPTTGLALGDLWFDTDNDNKPHRWSGSAWTDVQDLGLKILANDAQATADGKITTYYNASAPSTSLSLGDLWVDIDDANRMYRWSGSVWVDVQDTTVADNIYTANTTTIEGGNITTGTITADAISAGAITSDKITVNDNITFANGASGLIFGKTSLSDGTPGAFYGRGEDGNGASVAGFSISSTNSSLLMDSGGNFRMVNVGIFTGSPGVPQSFLAPSNNGSSAHIYNLPAGLTSLDIVVQGGGGGGSSNAAGDRPYQNSGAAGGFSRVRCYSGANGTGTLLSTISSTGGTGAPWSVQSNINTGVGAAGEASAKAAGGFGGPIPSHSGGVSIPGDGSLGSGGGSGGAYGGNGSADAVTNNGGGAGENKNVSSVPSGTASLVLIVGAGGLGGAGGTSNGSLIASGGDGGSGYVIITNPLGGGNEIDLVQIEADVAALTTGTAPSWNYQGANSAYSNSITTSWGSGAGWYTIKGGIGNRHNDDPALQSYVSDNRPWRTYFTGTPTCNGQYQQNQNTSSFSYTTEFYWYKEF